MSVADDRDAAARAWVESHNTPDPAAADRTDWVWFQDRPVSASDVDAPVSYTVTESGAEATARAAYEVTEAGRAALDAMDRLHAVTADMDAQDRADQRRVTSSADHELADEAVAEHG